METSRPCDDGFVCIDHECGTAPPVDAGPACTSDSDCPSTASHCSSADTCVQCIDSTQCSVAAPVCDATANTCRGCGADSECSSNVCDTNTGLCLDEADVLYASSSGADGAPCSKVDPCSITHATAISDSTRSTVKLASGTYTANLSVSGKTLSIHGGGATLNPSQAGSTLSIGVGTHLTLDGLTIMADASSAAVNCGPNDANATPIPSLDLDSVNIDTAGFIVVAYPCKISVRNSHFNARVNSPAMFIAAPSTAYIDRSIFEGRGVEAAGAGAVVHVTNSLFINQISNGEPSDPGPFSGLPFGNGDAGQAFASFTTFVGARILQCGSGLPACAGGHDSGACIDNSIITNGSGDAITGTGCHVSYSIVTPQAASLNGTNNHVNVDPLFVGGSSYALKSSSPAVDAADPNAVDTIDLAGTARPQGAHDDIGAYEYKP